MSKNESQEITLYPEICIRCKWSRLEGNVIFCPFAAGTCERKNQVFCNAVFNGSSDNPDEQDVKGE